MADLPSQVSNEDRLSILLAQSRVQTAEANTQKAALSVALSQQVLNSTKATFAQVEFQLRAKYQLGADDRFDGETGEISRAPAPPPLPAAKPNPTPALELVKPLPVAEEALPAPTVEAAPNQHS